MRRTIVDNPKHASSFVVGRGCHDLVHETVEGSNAGFAFAPTEELGAMDIHGSDVCPCATTFVFVFHLRGGTRIGRERFVSTIPSLDAGFLIGGENEFIFP